ncbi:patatin [Desulfosarcina widdelii]|uniref:Patatin n=1 Tax=Desulfosarcina widdelii TaxID=947919 RepID=A0A5K7Z7J1_9BACT|nr:patatin-like phospholipase family protein [Desulfosarcina widdelii]BBO76998.1 patatin [Desulfosarcina widdelii]
MTAVPTFNSVVFAGGGCRCVWQAGFWAVAAEPLGLDRAVIGSVSAGAAMACLVRSGRIDKGLALFKRRFAGNSRNIYLTRWGTGRPVFPQVAIYREGVLSVMDDSAMDRMRRGPDIRVLMARPPAWLSPQVAPALGIGTYLTEKHLKKPMHPTWATKVGFRPLVASVRECRSPGQLADLILQSSCTPPFVPLQYRGRQPVLDGGLIDNCPVATVADVSGPMLVLLSRRYPSDRIPHGGKRLYLQPSKEPLIGRWDYTNPGGLQATFDLGRRDAETFLSRLRR